MAEGYPPRVWRQMQRPIRSGVPLPSQDPPRILDLVTERKRGRTSGEEPGQEIGREPRGVRSQGAQRRDAPHPAPLHIRQACKVEPPQNSHFRVEAEETEKHWRHQRLAQTADRLGSQHHQQHQSRVGRFDSVWDDEHFRLHGQQPELREPGRHHRRERHRDVHGRVEERQALGVRHQRALGRVEVRGRVVQQQKIRIRRHVHERRHQRGGEV